MYIINENVRNPFCDVGYRMFKEKNILLICGYKFGKLRHVRIRKK